MIKVHSQDFDIDQEYQLLRESSPQIGAIVTFTGLVREFVQGDQTNVFLEHYPEMTEKILTSIIDQAKERWDIIQASVVHRIGHLTLGEQIVFVGVNSPHRQDAFQACEFIMDFLKTEAPFWKKEITNDGEFWVEAKNSDTDAKQRW